MKSILSIFMLLAIGTALATPPKAAIVSLNPTRKQPDPVPVGDALKVSPGKLQILKLDGYNGPTVTWQVIQPLDTKDAEVAIVEWTTLPKGSPIFGFLEGETKARKHVFDVETVVVLATGNGNGKVRVRALVCQEGVVQVVAEIIVQVVDVLPTPPNPPNPQPPDPTPVTPQKLFVVIIEETEEAVAKRGAMLSDAALLARMKEKGHKFRVVDRNVVDANGNPPADIKRFLEASKNKKLPQLFLVNEKGETVKTAELVENTAAELLDLLKKSGG